MEHYGIAIKTSHRAWSLLDKLYNKYVNESLYDIDEEDEERWDTYQIIMDELSGMGKSVLIKEIKYRLTDGEEPNEVFLDIINKDEDAKAHLWFQEGYIEQFKERDLFKRFY